MMTVAVRSSFQCNLTEHVQVYDVMQKFNKIPSLTSWVRAHAPHRLNSKMASCSMNRLSIFTIINSFNE